LGNKYLYTNQVDENIATEFYLSQIVICPMAKRRDSKGVYHFYGDYPKHVLKYIGQEYWQCFTADGGGGVKSEFPPMPKAIYDRFDSNEEWQVKIPDYLIPLAKEIYPDSNIPSNMIIKDFK
jgi:hypothetical protein